MREVWKFQLRLADYIPVSMPLGARLLRFGVQHGSLTLWALVDPAAPKTSRLLRLCGTGHAISPAESAHYVGTFETHGGDFVWHLFDLGERGEA